MNLNYCLRRHSIASRTCPPFRRRVSSRSALEGSRDTVLCILPDAALQFMPANPATPAVIATKVVKPTLSLGIDKRETLRLAMSPSGPTQRHHSPVSLACMCPQSCPRLRTGKSCLVPHSDRLSTDLYQICSAMKAVSSRDRATSVEGGRVWFIATDPITFGSASDRATALSGSYHSGRYGVRPVHVLAPSHLEI